MYSFPMYERLKVETPEFEQVAAFQAGLSQFSVRCEAVDQIPQSLSGEFVTGKYFSTLGIRAFAGRLLVPSDDQLAAPPVAVPRPSRSPARMNAEVVPADFGTEFAGAVRVNPAQAAAVAARVA